MKRFIEGVKRTQSKLFPALLDEYIAEDNGVGVIDVFIDSINRKALGWASPDSKDTFFKRTVNL